MVFLKRMLLVALASVCLAQGATAQNWPNLDPLLLSTLTQSGRAEATYWLPDHIDATQATQAIGVAYEYISGSAGNTTIALGHYRRNGAVWQFVRRLDGVFGHQPRDALFGPGWAEVTTLMPGPNDPRCCPTALTRWRIDLTRGAAVRLP
ncbi:MAG: hypothetical protein AAFY52_00440 [Pseudomonadota bacterium]